MVMAAERKISKSGIHSNIGRTSAILRLKKVSTQKKIKRVAAKKAPKKMKAAGVAKKTANSRRATLRKVIIVPSRQLC